MAITHQNVYFSSKGEIKKIGYKSLKGCIQLLKRINKACRKLNYNTEMHIQLPIKER